MVKKVDLAGKECQREVCLLSIDTDGTVYLTHVEAEIVDGATGEYCGGIVFNGEVRLSLAQFFWRDDD